MIREEMAFFEKTFTTALYQITQLPEVKQSRFIDITGNVTQADIIKRTLDKYQPQHAVCLMVEPVDFSAGYAALTKRKDEPVVTDPEVATPVSIEVSFDL